MVRDVVCLDMTARAPDGKGAHLGSGVLVVVGSLTVEKSLGRTGLRG